MIYFIQEKGFFRNRVKIGYTDNIRNRLRDLQSVMQAETIKTELSIKPSDYFAQKLDLNNQRNYDAEKVVVETWQDGSNFSACYRAWHKAINGNDYDGTINGDKIRVIKQILSAWGIGGFDVNQ